MYGGPGMTGQLLQRGQQAAHELYENLPSTEVRQNATDICRPWGLSSASEFTTTSTTRLQEVGRGLERGVEKGMDYMRDFRGDYGYGYNMGLGQRDMLGRNQGLMSSMIWPWNWFSSTCVVKRGLRFRQQWRAG
jgi:hypothetical protein